VSRVDGPPDSTGSGLDCRGFDRWAGLIAGPWRTGQTWRSTPSIPRTGTHHQIDGATFTRSCIRPAPVGNVSISGLQGRRREEAHIPIPLQSRLNSVGTSGSQPPKSIDAAIAKAAATLPSPPGLVPRLSIIRASIDPSKVKRYPGDLKVGFSLE